MPRFTVYQVQDVSETRRYQFTVEAESAEDAIDAVRCGDFPADAMEEVGRIGEPEFGDTGEFACPADQPEPDDAWELAIGELVGNWQKCPND